MLLELLSLLVLSPWTGATPATADEIVTVRHHSLGSEPNWTLQIRGDVHHQVSAHVWWIVGPAVHTGMPAHLIEASGVDESEVPDQIEAQVAQLTAVNCPALASIAGEFHRLSIDPRADSPHEHVDSVFVLETGEASIELHGLASGHPLVRWANRAWNELSACADDAATGT